jgi:hypothetical protein
MYLLSLVRAFVPDALLGLTNLEHASALQFDDVILGINLDASSSSSMVPSTLHDTSPCLTRHYV